MTQLYLLLTVAGIGLLMIIHEAGHFLAARWTGMRVLKFSIGFGPVLFRKQLQGSSTVFQIALVPFLAYVQIAGMNPFEENDPNDTELFDKKSSLARSFVIAAGPIANYLFASLVFFGLALHGLEERVPGSHVYVSRILPDGAAAHSELRERDSILAVNGVAVNVTPDVLAQVEPRANQPTVLRVERNGQTLEITLTPRSDGGKGRIGTMLAVPTRTYQPGVLAALKFGLLAPAETTVLQLQAIGDAIRRRTAENFGGVVSMGQASVEAARQGPKEWLGFLAFVSVALGFFNLLPFPALDGGRLVFLFIEVLFRRRVNEKIEASVNAFGMLTLLTLMVLITYRDILRLH